LGKPHALRSEAMSDEENPYQAPVAEAQPTEAHPLEGANITTTMITNLRQTRPWIRFLATLGFVYIGLFVLIGVGFVVTILLTSSFGDEQLPFVGIGFVYLVIAAIGFLPVRFLHRYAVSLKRLLNEGGTQTFEDAIRHQKSFWKFVGIACAVSLGFVAFFLVLSIILGIVGSLF
jgi:hypothetical protein